MYSGPVSIQVNGGRQGDPRLPFLINRGRVLLGPMLRHAEARGSLGVQKDRYYMEDGSYVDAMATPYVNILSIFLFTPEGGGGEPTEQFVFKHPLSFVVANEDLDIEGVRLPGRPEILGDLNWRYHQALHGATAVTWANHSGGARTYIWDGDGKFPCGNMTWFKTEQVLAEDGITFEPAATHVVSWQGPHNRAFSPAERFKEVPDTGTFIAVAAVSDDEPVAFRFTADPVYGAFIHGGFLAYINFNDATDTITMRKTRGADANGFAVWDEEWSTVLPANISHLGTHFFANSDGSECRAVGKEYIPAFSQLVELPDNNQRYLPECYISVELIVDTVTGVVTVGYSDKDDFPKYVATASDLVYDCVPTGGGKVFYFRDTVVPDQVEPTQSFNLYHSSGVATGRYPLPYVGEQYNTGGHRFTVVTVTPVDPLPRADQLTQRATDLEAMASENLNLNMRANSLFYPQLREAEFGRSVTIEVSWDVIDVDEFSDSVPIDPGATASVYNATDRAYFRWHRKQYMWTEGKSLACVGYDKDNNPMRAYVEADQRIVFLTALATGVGIRTPTPAELEAELDEVPSRYDTGPAFTPVELVDYAPLDSAPVGTVHDAYQIAVGRDRHRVMLRVETEAAEPPPDQFYRLVDYFAEFRDSRTATGYDPSSGWAAPWSTYDRNTSTNKLYADANGAYTSPADINAFDANNINVMVTTQVEYFDMVGGILLTTGVDDAEATTQDTNTQSMPSNLYITGTLDQIPGSTDAGPPDFNGHRLLSASFGDDNYTQDGTRWDSTSARVADRDAPLTWGQYTASDSAGVSTGAATFGVWGQKPTPGPINRQASLVVGVSMRATQTMLFDAALEPDAEQAIVTHWPALLPPDFQNRPITVGDWGWIFINDLQNANAAVDFEGAKLASIATEHKDEVPAEAISTAYQYLFGDTTHNLYGGFTPSPTAAIPVEYDPRDLWLLAQGATADYPSEVFYGAKPVIRIKVK